MCTERVALLTQKNDISATLRLCIASDLDTQLLYQLMCRERVMSALKDLKVYICMFEQADISEMKESLDFVLCKRVELKAVKDFLGWVYEAYRNSEAKELLQCVLKIDAILQRIVRGRVREMEIKSRVED